MSGNLWQSQVGRPTRMSRLVIYSCGQNRPDLRGQGTAVAAPSEIISAMHEAAPPGRQQPDDRVLGELRSLTQALIAARPDASEEYERFLCLGRRGIAVPETELAQWLGGATVLVTGGTGCIGSRPVAQDSPTAPAPPV